MNKMHKSKVSAVFGQKKAFVAYLMGGDPDLAATREYMLAMAEAGVDLIEIGIPFSDPMAEGDVIQKASLRALAAQTNIIKLFAMIESLKGEIKIPIALMTYLNPVYNYGYEAFCARCTECGVSALIIPDLPFEEQGEISSATHKHGVDLISLVAPTSGARVHEIAQKAEGFIYLVSSMGVTGVRQEITTDLASIVQGLRQHSTTPIAIGFGISSAEQASAMGKLADGIIIGSAIVRIIETHGHQARPHLVDYVKSIRAALDAL